MKNKLLFIHLGTLSDNVGHTARLRYELDALSKTSDISVISLGGGVDLDFEKNYPDVHLKKMPIFFEGWNVLGVDSLSRQIAAHAVTTKVDLVILCLEIWDLIVALNKQLKNKVPFCCTCHAMPFLISPQVPSGDYFHDVQNLLKTSLPLYRREYISRHSHELVEIMQKHILVANNPTVGHYFRTYFPHEKFWEQNSFVTVSPKKVNQKKVDFDFCYMARMEQGKGVEYLNEILTKISQKLGRKVSVAILGRADDEFSDKALGQLIADRNNSYVVSFFGWADNQAKEEVLSRSGCFLYPSCYDSFPTVVHEALSYGLPVVMWDVLFYRINYQGVQSIKAAPFLDTDTFSDIAVELLFKREVLKEVSIRFIHEKSDIKKLADADNILFEKIIKHHERST